MDINKVMSSITDALNIRSSDRNHVSLAKSLIIFYILVASNFTRNLYSGRMQDFISNNRVMQHIIGYITMLVIVINFGGVTQASSAFLYSMLAYIWFVCTTKLNLTMNLVILALIVVAYLYENKINSKEDDSSHDAALTDVELDRMHQEHRKFKNIMIGGLILVTVAGTYLYYSEKRDKFGDQFELEKFFVDGPKRYVLVS